MRHSDLKAVVFDLDGTIVNSDLVVLEAFQFALEPYGHKITPADVERIRSRNSNEVFEGFVERERWKEVFDRLAQFSNQALERVPVFDGIHALLKEIHDGGKRMAIWTGRDAHSAGEILAANGISDYFEHTVGGCMVTRNKPFPEGLFMVAEKLALEPATLLMVGDHAHDAEGSRLAGTKFAGVAWSQRANISAFGSDNVGVFRTVAGLRTWLKKNVL